METRTETSLPLDFHATSKIEEVPLSDLRVDRSYQRDPSQTLVDEIAADWDIVASELILVSDRGVRSDGNGGLWLVNGQHRSLAARKLGHEKIWARVVDLSGIEDPGSVEANLRLKLNVKLSDRPLERFKAQLRSGDEDSLNIVKILARYDTEINQVANSDSGVNCISTIEAVYMIDQGGLLGEIVETVRDAFGTLGGRAVSAGMMKAVGWFIEKHANESDRTRLINKMNLEGTSGLYRRAINMKAAMGGSTWMNYYRALIEIYNDGLTDKSKLKWQTRGAGTFAARGRWGITESTSWGSGGP